MKFIRLTNMIINPFQVSVIIVKENIYHMHLNKMSGVMLLGSGTFDSDRINVCKDKHPDDYKVITEWIEKNAK